MLEGMVLYVNQMNYESNERYEREMKEYNAFLLSSKSVDTEGNPEQSTEPEPAKMKAPDGTNDTTMKTPNPQIISSPNSQNTSQTILELSSQFSTPYPRTFFPVQPHFATSSLFATNYPES